MNYKFNPDILLEVPNKEEFLAFFKDVLDFKVEKYTDDLHEVNTGSVNFYIKESTNFKVIFDFLVDNPNDSKDDLVNQSDCKIYRWNEVGHHIEHNSGFTFNLGHNSD
jgi:hypothetical protein